MTDQELADRFGIDIAELHAKVEALPDGQTKRRAKRLASILHRAAEEIADIGSGNGMIQPFSGGDPKPDDPNGP